MPTATTMPASTPSLSIRFDPAIKVTYGYYECTTCGSKYYGGGPRGCQHTTAPEIYHYGPSEKAKLESGQCPALGPWDLLDLYRAQQR